MNTITRIPPNSKEAELAVIGALLYSPEMAAEVRAQLTEDCFYFSAHRSIWKSACELLNRLGSVDVMSLTQRLNEKHLLEDVGGPNYITEAAVNSPVAGHVHHYTEKVLGLYHRRQLIQLAGQLEQQAWDNTESAPAEIGANAIRGIAELAASRHDSRHVGDVIGETVADIQRIMEHPNEVLGMRTGFAMLDKLTDGMQPNQFWILAGRPGMGKTALAINMAYNVASNDNPVLVFSLEQRDRELVKRTIASLASVNMRRLRGGTPDTMDKVQQAAQSVCRVPLWIDDNSRHTPATLRAAVMRHKIRHDIKLVVLDYIQLIKPARGHTDDMRLHITEVSGEIMAIAKEFGVTFLALSQFSRGTEQQQRRPRMSDLRESGSLEQDAHVILLLSGDVKNEELPKTLQGAYAGQEDLKHLVHVNLAKQREGDTMPIFLRFNREFTRFENIGVAQ